MKLVKSTAVAIGFYRINPICYFYNTLQATEVKDHYYYDQQSQSNITIDKTVEHILFHYSIGNIYTARIQSFKINYQENMWIYNVFLAPVSIHAHQATLN